MVKGVHGLSLTQMKCDIAHLLCVCYKHFVVPTMLGCSLRLRVCSLCHLLDSGLA